MCWTALSSPLPLTLTTLSVVCGSRSASPASPQPPPRASPPCLSLPWPPRRLDSGRGAACPSPVWGGNQLVQSFNGIREAVQKSLFLGKFSQVSEPTHPPQGFVRFGKTKGDLWVKKGDFRGDLCVCFFEGFGPCLGIRHPTHPHLGILSKKTQCFLDGFPNLWCRIWMRSVSVVVNFCCCFFFYCCWWNSTMLPLCGNAPGTRWRSSDCFECSPLFHIALASAGSSKTENEVATPLRSACHG